MRWVLWCVWWGRSNNSQGGGWRRTTDGDIAQTNPNGVFPLREKKRGERKETAVKSPAPPRQGEEEEEQRKRGSAISAAAR
nr:unnamed protein product [Digitaria exilis]